MENNKILGLLLLLGLMIAAYFLGKMLSKLFGNNKSVDSENDWLQSQIQEKEAELLLCKQKNNTLNTTSIPLENNAINIQPEPIIPLASSNLMVNHVESIVEEHVSPEAEVTELQKQDLKVIEGIGPKIEELLHNAGILTYNQLATSTVENIKNILEAAGPRYQIHDPGTWPQQSALCAEGKWTALKSLQDELNKGKAN